MPRRKCKIQKSHSAATQRNTTQRNGRTKLLKSHRIEQGHFDWFGARNDNSFGLDLDVEVLVVERIILHTRATSESTGVLAEVLHVAQTGVAGSTHIDAHNEIQPHRKTFLTVKQNQI